MPIRKINNKKDQKRNDNVTAKILKQAELRDKLGTIEDLPLQTEYPESVFIPAAAEIKAAGSIGRGLLRTVGGLTLGNVGAKDLGRIGNTIDNTLGTKVFSPALGFVGGLGGYVLGSRLTNAMIPTKVTYGPTNYRTALADDQTPTTTKDASFELEDPILIKNNNINMSRIPANDSESMSINFTNYFGKPISDLTVSDWDSFINGNPINTYGLNMANLRRNFNRYKDEFSSGNTYHGVITGDELFDQIRQMSRDRVPYDMYKHKDVLDYMREYVGPQYLSNLQEAVSNKGMNLRQIEIDHIKDVFANPSKYIDISHGYVKPGTGGYAMGDKITVPFDINFTDITFAHELHHALRNHLMNYLQPNYDIFGFTANKPGLGRHWMLGSGDINRNGRQPYFDFELDAMHDLAFNTLQSSDKTPSSEIGATITSEYTFPRFKAMTTALGRFPEPQELWNAMNNGSVESIGVPLAYRDAIGSAHKDARSEHWAKISQQDPHDRYKNQIEQWQDKPLWYRIWNVDQKPKYRNVTSRIQKAHKEESINQFRNAIKSVMTAVPGVAAPIVGYNLINEEQVNKDKHGGIIKGQDGIPSLIHPRIVTDKYGSWYEVDVPQDYNTWERRAYKQGGILKAQSGK